MARYTPAIQDAFRRTGFPIERSGKVHQVTFTPSDSAPVQMVELQRWEYRNREETWSVLVTEDSVILQTTAYTRFEEFADRLQLAVNTVLTESEQARFGVVHRVGLRYIDMVRPSASKDFRFYLRPGLHGVRDEVFQPGRHLLHVESRGQTVPGTPATWNPQVAFLVFPRITSSPRIERRAMSRFAARSHHISTLPVADQVRELQTALSVNKSELARILRVSRPTEVDAGASHESHA